MRAFITGATGFIGSALTKHLYQANFKIRALTRNPSHPDVLNNTNYNWIAGDVTAPDGLLNACDMIDVVFHAAGFAHASQQGDLAFQKKHDQVNALATIALAKAAADAGVKRFIFFSSIKASKEASSRDPYAQAKYKAEQALLEIGENTKMAVVILRLSLVYGEGWKGNLAALLKAIDKNRIPPMPKINNRKSMVSVQDVCQASILAATMHLDKKRCFIITDNIPYSTNVIDQLMRQALGKREVLWSTPKWLWYCLGAIGDLLEYISKRTWSINTEKIEKLFSNSWYDENKYAHVTGYAPQYTLADVLPDIVSAYRA